jgi:anti-sigma B factor antagonist
MESEPLFTTRTEWRNRVANVALVGELDIASVPMLEEDLAPVEGNGIVSIVLDLRELTFLDGSAVHALVAAHRRAQANGHRLVVIGADQRSKRLFELTRTEFLLAERDTLDVLEQFTGAGLVQQGDTEAADERADN